MVDTKDVDNNSKIRLEWIDVNVEAVLPKATYCERVKSCCGGEQPLPEKTKSILKNGKYLADE